MMKRRPENMPECCKGNSYFVAYLYDLCKSIFEYVSVYCILCKESLYCIVLCSVYICVAIVCIRTLKVFCSFTAALGNVDTHCLTTCSTIVAMISDIALSYVSLL